MNIDPSTQSPEERQLQEVFDETAAVPSEAQLARMIARAEQIPGGGQRGQKGWRGALLFPLAAAAAVALAIGGAAWWAQDRDDGVPAASTALAVPTATPTATPTAVPTAVPKAVASVDQEQDPIPTDDTYDDLPALPTDPLAVLDGDFDNGGAWMGELDLLHGDGDDGFWEEMELLMEEGG